jgi:hypothetical protein
VRAADRKRDSLYYNSAILSRLLRKYEASGNAKALALIKKMPPGRGATST